MFDDAFADFGDDPFEVVVLSDGHEVEAWETWS